MTDTELEDRVRTTLRAVAQAHPIATPRRRWPAVAAVASIALLAGTLAVAARDDVAEVRVTQSPPAASTATSLPSGYDVHTAGPVFSAPGSVDEVAEAYLRDRFPDYPTPGVAFDKAVLKDGLATVRWSTESEVEGELGAGAVLLRSLGQRWVVVASTTDGLDLSDLVFDGQRVRGTVRSTSSETFQVSLVDDLLEDTHDGTTPRTFGPAIGSVEVDRTEPHEPVVVRVQHVGDTVLSIAEVRLDRPSTAFAVVSEGDGWDLVATDEADGHWVALRAAELEGIFRLQTEGDFDTLFTSLGPCCRAADAVFVVGALRADATHMQVTLSDRRVVVAEAHADDVTGVRYAIAAIPLSDLPADTSAGIEVRLADGTVTDAGTPIDLATIGG